MAAPISGGAEIGAAIVGVRSAYRKRHSAAHILQNTFADTGKCYRIGGDDFAVICTGIDEQGIRFVLERLQNNLQQHNRFQEVPLSFAWGYAMRKTPEDTADALFERADEAMYACKQRQKKEREKSKDSCR